MTTFYARAAGLAAMLTAAPALAEPLSLAQTLERAEAYAPSLHAAQQQIASVTAQAIPAAALPDPKIIVEANDAPVSGPLAGRPDRDNFSMLTLGVAQEVPNNAKRQARRRQAQADITVAEAEARQERRTVRIAAALAWIDLYYAEHRLTALDDLQRELRLETGAAPAQLASGAGRPAASLEPALAEADLADRRAALQAEAIKARAALGRWIGPAEAVVPAGAPPGDAVAPEALIAGLDRLPILQIKTAALHRAETGVAAAQAEKQSDWSYEVDYSHRDPRFGDYVSAKFSVSLPIFAATRQDPAIAAQRSAATRARLERDAARQAVLADLQSDLAEQAMRRAVLMRARDTRLPLVKQRLDLETASYRAGAASLGDLLSARRALIDEQLNLLDREADAVRGAVRISLTYGDDQP